MDIHGRKDRSGDADSGHESGIHGRKDRSGHADSGREFHIYGRKDRSGHACSGRESGQLSNTRAEICGRYS